MATIWAFRCGLVLVITLAALLLLSPTVVSAAGETPPSLVAGETAFAFDLYGRLKGGEGNLFFSPYSISTCLGMTYVGARGDTARQMAAALHFDAAPGDLPTPMAALEKQLNEIRQQQPVELNTANGLWAQSGHPFLPAYLEICRQQFGAQVNQADFRTEAEPTRKLINDWVAAQTKNKITDLLKPGMIVGTTRLVLVNAIYFKGKWEHQFEKSRTAEAPFFITPDRQVRVPMMHQDAHFRYVEAGGVQLLEMPYMGGPAPSLPPTPKPLNRPFTNAPEASDELSMVILLPKETNGLAKLEAELNASNLNEWLIHAVSQKVQVFLPRFKMTAELQLSRKLSAMGMPLAFSSGADFSGMDGRRDLFISDVVHKAFVDVNEEGTEAAAATGTVMMGFAVMRPTIFRADHPFIFLIRDTHTGSILFLGRVVDPTK